MKTAKQKAEKVEKAMRYCSTEVKIETLTKGLESYAKEHAIEFRVREILLDPDSGREENEVREESYGLYKRWINNDWITNK